MVDAFKDELSAKEAEIEAKEYPEKLPRYYNPRMDSENEDMDFIDYDSADEKSYRFHEEYFQEMSLSNPGQ